MGKLKNIVHLSKEQLETLLLTGKVTADGITVNYTPDDVHVIPIAEYDKFMTTDTQQVITGAKDFRGGITVNGEPISRKLYLHNIAIFIEHANGMDIYTGNIYSTAASIISLDELYNIINNIEIVVYDSVNEKFIKISLFEENSHVGVMVHGKTFENGVDSSITVNEIVREV